jgi:hypothetical protein
MLCAMGMAEPSFTAPSHKPVTKAATIIKKPPSADAAPAAFGKGPTAPL